MRIFEWAIVNIFKLIHDSDFLFTAMYRKMGSPTFHTLVLKYIHERYNIHTCFLIITSNAFDYFNVKCKQHHRTAFNPFEMVQKKTVTLMVRVNKALFSCRPCKFLCNLLNIRKYKLPLGDSW